MFPRRFIITLICAAVLLSMGSCKMIWRALRYNVPSVNDYKLWEERPIRTGGESYALTDGKETGIPPASEWALGKWHKENGSPEDYFRETGTVAFLVLRGDTLLYEYYAPEYSGESRFNSFSLSKVYLSTLVGIAIEEGHIDSLNQSIGDFLPWCRDSAFCNITIRNLLQMTSGLASSEGYLNPWATSTKLYYGDQMEDIVHDLKIRKAPNKSFFYQNINSQLMGIILARATGKPLATYLEEKLWTPMGMEADAGWSLHEDSDIEKAFCCLNARARDFARFGVLFLNKGKWRGKQLVSEAWVKQATMLDTVGASSQRYQFNWYTSAEQEDYYGQGLLGQFTYVSPSTRTVIVRLGNSLDYKVPWYDVFKILSGLAEKPQPMAFRKRDLKPFAGNWHFALSNTGDSALYGKVAKITATAHGLKVRTTFNKTWQALPQNDSAFYNIRYGRRIRFFRDSTGQVESMRWTRRGNSWILQRKAPQNEP